MVVNNVNPNKLHDELIRAGIIPVLVTHDAAEGKYIAENTWIAFADNTNMTAVQAVIDAHDPTPTETPEQKITRLKAELEQTDYKVIKCSECQLAGLEMPYDIAVLHTERQTLRDRINELEITLS